MHSIQKRPSNRGYLNKLSDCGNSKNGGFKFIPFRQSEINKIGTTLQSPCALIKVVGAPWQKANVAPPLRKLCEEYEAGSTPIAESDTLIKALYWRATIGL